MGFFDRLFSGVNLEPQKPSGVELELRRRLTVLASDEATQDTPLRYFLHWAGQVQGVGFRFTNTNLAQARALTGWVRNMEDGSVEMEIQGAPANILSQLEAYFMSLGFGQTVRCTAEQHDHMIAFTSQLAHVVSSAYIKSPEADKHHGYSAGSYKDLTRVAKLNETMWTELFLVNKDYLADEIDGLVERLQAYSKVIRSGDGDTLKAMLKDGKEKRLAVDVVKEFE